MSEERTPYGPQLKFQVHIVYQLYQAGEISDDTELLTVAAGNATQVARLVLDHLDRMTPPGGRITNLHINVVIDDEA